MKPAFKITVNGSDITALIADRLLSLTVTDEAGVKSDRVEIVIDDRDQRLAIPSKKATMTVAIGYADRLVNKGTYTVEEVEMSNAPRQMTIRANAAGASKGSGARREKSYHETTLGKVAGEIAKRNKWELRISSGLSNIEIPHVDQTESDLQFVTRLATENGAVAKVAHGKLVIAPHGEGKTTSGRTLPSVTLLATDTVQWSCVESSRGDYEGVKARYHDPKTGKTEDAIDGKDGETTATLPHTYANKGNAERAAKAKRGALQKGKATLSISNAPGNPNFEAESRLTATGFRKGVDGQWTMNSVSHQINDSGYTCSIQCERV